MAPHNAAARVDEITRAPVNVLVKEARKCMRACTTLSDKTQTHALTLLGSGQAELSCQGAHVGLVERPKGEEGMGETRRGHGREVVGLVFGGVHGALDVGVGAV